MLSFFATFKITYMPRVDLPGSVINIIDSIRPYIDTWVIYKVISYICSLSFQVWLSRHVTANSINNQPHAHVPCKRHSPGASYNVYYYHLSLFELYDLFISIFPFYLYIYLFIYLFIYILTYFLLTHLLITYLHIYVCWLYLVKCLQCCYCCHVDYYNYIVGGGL